MTAVASGIEILNIINTFIANFVVILESYGIYIFAFGMVFFAIWFAVQMIKLIAKVLNV